MTLSLIDTTSGAGDNLKAGGDKINAALRQIDSRSRYSRPPRIVFIGNSQSSNTASLGVASLWFWAQVRNPRLYDWNNKAYSDTTGNVLPNGQQNLARSGNRSGPYSGYAGQPTGAGGGPDTNSATIINGAKLVDPDIVLCIDGITNDGSIGSPARTESYNNMKAAIQAIGAPKNIILSSPPRYNVSNPNVHYHNQMMRYWATQDPSLTFVDVTGVLIDPNTNFDPIGGNSGSAIAVTDEGLHYSILGARKASYSLDQALDQVGVPRTQLPVASLGNIYNSSTNPFGNLMGTKGAMQGNAGTHSNSASTGEVATGWNIQNYGTQVTAVASKSTLVLDGVTHTAQQIDFSTAATTVGVQTIQMSMTGGGFAHPGNFKAIVSSLLQIINLVGCTGFVVQFGTNGGDSCTMGSRPNGGVAAQLIPSGLNEILQMLQPGLCSVGSAGAAGVTFSITFAAGIPAGALGSIKFANVCVLPQPNAI